MEALFSITKDRSIAVGNTSTLVLPARQTRVFARLTNDSNEVIYLMLGETARMNQGMRLNAAGTTRDFWETNSTNLYNGAIYAICATGGKNLLVLEDSPSQSSSSCSSSSCSSSSSFSSSSFSSSSSSFSSCSSSSRSSSCSSSSFSSSSCSSSSQSSSCSSSSSFSSSCSSSSCSSSSCSSSFSSSCSSSYSCSSSSSASCELLDLDTGWKSPASNGSLWNNWSNGANAYVDDLNYATAEGTKTNDYGTFTFGLPAGAIIRGIEFYLKGFKEQVGDTTFPVYLSWNSGANMTAAKNVVVTGSNVESANTIGGATDKWGHEWTVDETGNANFWVGIDTNGAIGDDFDINHIQMKIYYQNCSSSSSSSSSFSSCSSSFSSSSSCSSSFSSCSSSFSSCSSSFSSSSSCSSSFSSSSYSSCSSSFSSSSCSSSSFSSSSSSRNTTYYLPTSTGWPGANEWTNPNNAFACDDVYTTRTGDAGAYYYQGYEVFGFPDFTGLTITDIEVKISGKSTEGGKTIRCEIYSASAGIWTNAKTNTFATSEEVKTYGGVADLWGTSWIPTDFTDGNFALRISSEQEISNLSIDCIEIKVTAS